MSENKIVYIPFGRHRKNMMDLYQKNFDYIEAEVEKYKHVNGNQRWFCPDCQKQLSVGSQVAIRRHFSSKTHLFAVGKISEEESKNPRNQGRKKRVYIVHDVIPD